MTLLDIAANVVIERDALINALRQAFPHFQDDTPVTPEAIIELGREYMALIMDAGPQRIEFVDHDGNMKAIVYECGDSSVGIGDGWVLE